jgi:gamma-glutamyl-gamma-aminobutyrate hydrolase PuuD
VRPYGTALRRPVVGITPDVEAEGDVSRYVVKTAYADAVLRAGGLPLVLPLSTEATVVEAYLDRVAAVVVTGGAFDVPPEAYGQAPKEGLGPQKPIRTAFETLVLQTALRRKLPILAICGGMQLLNVVLGGELFQDLRRELHPPPGGLPRRPDAAGERLLPGRGGRSRRIPRAPLRHGRPVAPRAAAAEHAAAARAVPGAGAEGP